MQITRTKWFLPGFTAVMGVVIAVASWVGGDSEGAVIALAISLGAASLMLIGGRSETVRGLRGDGRDERFRRIDIEATAITGTVVLAAIIVGFIVEIARGHNGSPYTWLAAVGGVTYIASVVVMRARG
jgi:hypothetical protein